MSFFFPVSKYPFYLLCRKIFGGSKKSKNEDVSSSNAAQPSDGLARELPVEKWNTSLQSLYLQNNKISFLPDYIGQLVGLSRLDISKLAGISHTPNRYAIFIKIFTILL